VRHTVWRSRTSARGTRRPSSGREDVVIAWGEGPVRRPGRGRAPWRRARHRQDRPAARGPAGEEAIVLGAPGTGAGLVAVGDDVVREVLGGPGAVDPGYV